MAEPKRTKDDAKEETPIDSKAHRRLLRFLNAARSPEDLAQLERAGLGKEVARELIEKRESVGAFGYPPETTHRHERVD